MTNAAEKKKFSLNALDVAVILVIIVLIATVAVRSGIAQKMTFAPEEFSVSVKTSETDVNIYEELKNKTVYNEDGDEVGVVSNIRTISVDGVVTGYEIDVISKLMKKNGRYVLSNGDIIISGLNLSLHTQTVTFNAEIDKIETVSQK